MRKVAPAQSCPQSVAPRAEVDCISLLLDRDADVNAGDEGGLDYLRFGPYIGISQGVHLVPMTICEPRRSEGRFPRCLERIGS
jgi:hypothetical protein